MTENPAPLDHSAPASSGAFLKLFGTGVAGWLAGVVLLYGAAWFFSEPETASIAALWMISHCWIAFLFGLLLMIICGLMMPRASLAMPLLAYVLPAVLLVGLSAISLAIYPDIVLRSDLLTYLPVVLVFYIIGWLWLALRGARADSPAFLRAVIPSLVGGLVIFGIIAVPAFASDSFRYRSAFELTTEEKKIENGVFVYEGTLKIMKPGNYVFLAPRYTYSELEYEEGETGFELGDIQWGPAGAPEDGAQGSFPLRIVWEKDIFSDSTIDMSPYDDYVILEVRKPDEGDRLVFTVIAETKSEP